MNILALSPEREADTNSRGVMSGSPPPTSNSQVSQRAFVVVVCRKQLHSRKEREERPTCVISLKIVRQANNFSSPLLGKVYSSQLPVLLCRGKRGYLPSCLLLLMAPEKVFFLFEGKGDAG